MRPFILNFVEQAPNASNNFSQLRYENSLNLTVEKSTGLPAISLLNTDSETITKAGVEVTDTDRTNSIDLSLVSTNTVTLVASEASDSDNDLQWLSNLLDTNTLTEVAQETTDSDK